VPFLGTRGAGSNRAFGYAGAAKPNQVTGLTATDFGTSRAFNNGRIDLSWTTPGNNGATISGYLIERSTNGSSYSTLVASTGTSATTYSDTSLTSSQIYYYKVSAINAAGTGDASTAASATATTVPQAPTIGTAAGSNASATVTYTANATGGKAVSAYTATSSPGSLTGTGASPITVSGLTNGTAYTFTVTATNANGTSTASAASNSVTPNFTNFFQIINYSGSQNFSDINRIRFDASNNMYTSATYTQSGLSGTMPVALRQTALGAITWQKGLSNNSTTNRSWGIAFDSSGNVYLTGALVAGAESTGILAKYNSSGTLQWQRTLTDYPRGDSRVYATKLFVDSSNVIWVYGELSAQGDGSITQGYISTFDTNGSITNRWALNNNLSGGNYSNVNELVVASSGNRYWSGSLYDTTSGQFRSFLTKHNSSNARTFLTTYTGSYDSGSGLWRTATLNSIKVDSSENVYAIGGGLYSGNISVNTVLKFNSSGTLQWQKAISGSNATSYGIAIDSSGNSYALLAKQGSPNTTYLLKYNTSGDIQWQRSFTNIWLRDPNIAVSNDGNSVYFGGQHSTGQKPVIIRYPADGSITGTYITSGCTTVIAATSLTANANGEYRVSDSGYSYITGTYPTVTTSSLTDVTLTATASTIGL
jgi:hypothetical protein